MLGHSIIDSRSSSGLMAVAMTKNKMHLVATLSNVEIARVAILTEVRTKNAMQMRANDIKEEYANESKW